MANPQSYNQNITKASYRTPFPGNKQAGYAEILGDFDQLNIPLIDINSGFHRNLALEMSDSELTSIGTYLDEAIEEDNQSRQKSLNIVRETIDLMGIGNDKPRVKANGQTGSVASEIYGPTLLKLAIKNTAKLHGTLFPAKGFVDCETFGLINEQIEDQADRMKDYMNMVTSEIIPGYSEEKKQAILWMCISGQFFTKVYFDKTKNRPACPYIRSDEIIINPGASSVSDAERVTYRYTISRRKAMEKFRNSEWREVRLEDYSADQSSIQKKIDSKVGSNFTDYEKNKFYEIDECRTYLDLETFGHRDRYGRPSGIHLPYVVAKDSQSGNIVGIWNNYNERDTLFRPIEDLVQYKFFTGPGPNGLGLAHMLSGLANTETQILQQLILSGEFSNNPAYISKATNRSEKSQFNALPGTNIQMQAFASQNIQDAIMLLETKEPSQVLFDLMTNVISPAMDDISAANSFSLNDVPPNMTATLVSAIVNASHIMEDSIIKSLYDSFSKELRLLFNVCGQSLPQSPYPFRTAGKSTYIMQEDFSPNLQIKPIIDPNASSSMQQIVMSETVFNLASQNPDLYNMHEVNKMILRSIKVNDIDKILLPEQKDEVIPELDFISENARVYRGESIKVYAGQNHEAHNIGHEDAIVRLQNDESVDNSAKIAALQDHKADHDAFSYVAQIQAITNRELPQDLDNLSPQIQNKISIIAAKAIQKQQANAAKQNPPPVDPNAVAMKEQEVKELELHIKAKKNEQDLQISEAKYHNESTQTQVDIHNQQLNNEYKREQLLIDREKLELQRQELEAKTQIEMARIELERRKVELEAQAKSYESTLKHEAEQEKENNRLNVEMSKTNIEAQTKAYDSTLKYKSSKEKEDESINNDTDVVQ
jgi:hypothetical protein